MLGGYYIDFNGNVSNKLVPNVLAIIYIAAERLTIFIEPSSGQEYLPGFCGITQFGFIQINVLLCDDSTFLDESPLSSNGNNLLCEIAYEERNDLIDVAKFENKVMSLDCSSLTGDKNGWPESIVNEVISIVLPILKFIHKYDKIVVEGLSEIEENNAIEIQTSITEDDDGINLYSENKRIGYFYTDNEEFELMIDSKYMPISIITESFCPSPKSNPTSDDEDCPLWNPKLGSCERMDYRKLKIYPGTSSENTDLLLGIDSVSNMINYWKNNILKEFDGKLNTKESDKEILAKVLRGCNGLILTVKKLDERIDEIIEEFNGRSSRTKRAIDYTLSKEETLHSEW